MNNLCQWPSLVWSPVADCQIKKGYYPIATELFVLRNAIQANCSVPSELLFGKSFVSSVIITSSLGGVYLDWYDRNYRWLLVQYHCLSWWRRNGNEGAWETTLSPSIETSVTLIMRHKCCEQTAVAWPQFYLPLNSFLINGRSATLWQINAAAPEVTHKSKEFPPKSDLNVFIVGRSNYHAVNDSFDASLYGVVIHFLPRT